ncbi:Zn-ribbon domain-containing OB-fold protein [Euzebya tangerina]|uniref:Zn-ribbon domain-containing OB-fold protein n=1 Tax=Euzebya tangerina TaxID=591198 RepID=UPI00196B9D02|nr:OB-fold domain-containing protein [Euzebya tangerina]
MILDAQPERPAPVATDLGRPFWEAAREHRLVRPVCDRCGEAHFPPLPACPHCQSPAWTWTSSVGTGTVHSWTRLHRAPEPGFPAPYVLADVDLDDGWSMLTNIVGAAEVTIGMGVRVAWLPVADGAVLPVFVPLGGGA